MRKLLLSIATLFIITACEFQPYVPSPEPPPSSARYTVDQDYSPGLQLDPEAIHDAEPKLEPITKAGNTNPYEVFGKTYHLLPSAIGYKEQGGASWYGLKFHGHQTANGEVYSIYDMTAAHKTLPIPSYVKVTNVANDRMVIVRVNDRGPFHEGRIIDLSYSAATKLGYIGEGTAQVVVEAIDPAAWQAEQKLKEEQAKLAAAQGIYLQVGAYTESAVAQHVYQTLYAQNSYPIKLETGEDQFFRIKIGPVTESEVDKISSDLLGSGYPQPIRLK